jgi:DNA topoisomerase-2
MTDAISGSSSSEQRPRVRVLDHLSHILLRPDTYVGALKEVPQQTWFVNHDNHMEYCRVSYSPALLKMADEVLVNACDAAASCALVRNIVVSVDRSDGFVEVFNDGIGIQIARHEQSDLWIPEVVFSVLLSSTNYDDTEKRVVGGRNGYGAKLANVFSRKFVVSVDDDGQHYEQIFYDNMSKRDEARVRPMTADERPCVRVRFYPDLPRMDLSELPILFQDLLRRRCYDVAAYLVSIGKQCTITFNGSVIEISTFQEYAEMFHAECNACADLPRGIALSVGPHNGRELQQVSIVNGIFTASGGKHVDDIVEGLWRNGANEELSKTVDDIGFHEFRRSLFLVLSVQLANPEFSSQQKDRVLKYVADLDRPVWNAGIAKQAVRSLTRSGTMARIADQISRNRRNRAHDQAQSASSGAAFVPKLINAVLAGTERSREAVLILTEGDSAKALVASSLSSEDRKVFGVYPLKGKFVNVHETPRRELMENEEVSNIMKALNLSFELPYDNEEHLSTLKYGHVMLMTDQDHDGAHIKGLLINFFHFFWPRLLEGRDFLLELRTPIVKAMHRITAAEECFFSLKQYKNWQDTLTDEEQQQWVVKYYKGLGTSTTDEGRSYFARKDRFMRKFVFDAESRSQLDVFFAGESEERKNAILTASRDRQLADAALLDVSIGASDAHAEGESNVIRLSDFISRQLIPYGIHVNVRVIPSVVDGFKPAQRKILFTLMRHSAEQAETKVAELVGLIIRETKYHHGDSALSDAVIKMAQYFVGSNNLPLLEAIGQFGSRLANGADAAQPRYIATKLHSIVDLLFPRADLPLLEYMQEEGQPVEPRMLAPIVPTVLINPSRGIGMGFSSEIPGFHPLEICDRLLEYLQFRLHALPAEAASLRWNDVPALKAAQWVPFFRGFRGRVVPDGRSGNSFITFGRCYRMSTQRLLISELPIGVSTQEVLEYYQSLVDDGVNEKPLEGLDRVDSVGENGRIAIDLRFHTENVLNAFLTTDWVKTLRLQSTVSFSNVHVFDQQGSIVRCMSVADIFDQYIPFRLDLFSRRKHRRLAELRDLLDRQKRVLEYISDRVVLQQICLCHLDNTDPCQILRDRGFPLINDTYDYLLRDINLTAVRRDDVVQSTNALQLEYDGLLSMSPEKLWMQELVQLREAIQQELAMASLPDPVLPSRAKELVPRKVTSSLTESAGKVNVEKENMAAEEQPKKAGVKRVAQPLGNTKDRLARLFNNGMRPAKRQRPQKTIDPAYLVQESSSDDEY